MSTKPHSEGSVHAEVARLTRASSALGLASIAFALLSEAANKLDGERSIACAHRDVYTTRKGNGPPGVSHRRWRKIAPTIRGAHRVGRYWIVPRDAYAEHAASLSDAHRRTQQAPAPFIDVAPWTPDQALYEAGLTPSPPRP